MQPQKPRIRVRPNLTSLQIDDSQKATIDEAFKVFKQSANIPNVTKGQFIEGLCQDFLHHAGGPDASTVAEQPDTNMLGQ